MKHNLVKPLNQLPKLAYRPSLITKMPLVTISQSLDESFTKHKVVPEVIDKFSTQGLLTIEYQLDLVALGNTLGVDSTQNKPEIQFTLNLPTQDGKFESIGANDRFILVLTDPDAPSNSDHKWSEYAHWLVTDLPLVSSDPSASETEPAISFKLDVSKGKELLAYEGPAPPPKTGKHRYVFLLYKQDAEKSDLPVPQGRPTWGTSVAGSGVRDWIEKNAPQLKLLAVNFFYAKNDE